MALVLSLCIWKLAVVLCLKQQRSTQKQILRERFLYIIDPTVKPKITEKKMAVVSPSIRVLLGLFFSCGGGCTLKKQQQQQPYTLWPYLSMRPALDLNALRGHPDFSLSPLGGLIDLGCLGLVVYSTPVGGTLKPNEI